MRTDLNQVVQLHITARVQNSNCHHWKWRGQWKVKEGLVTISKSIGMDIKDLLAMDTPEKIEAVIRRYEESRPVFSVQQSNLATKVDSNDELRALRSEVAAMQAELLKGLKDVYTEVQAQRKEIAALRNENAALKSVRYPPE